MDRPIIEKLPVELANLIAAGEVVERPASVVKELVENSIDACATIIRIDLMEYGSKKIIILDNGYGMTESDIEIAVLPHATSKIKKQADLFAISTLGFRGEALPSINSVSKMKITSSIDGYNGICKIYQAGVCIESKNVSFTKGTQIEVNDLFYNTPARLKHLSSNQIELSHIVALVNRFALSNPTISFVLSNNGKVLFSSNGDNDYLMIIRSVYGQEVAKNMLYFEDTNGLYKIKGYTSSNSVFRSNRNSITLIINKRVIKNLSLIYAITDAYKTYLPVGKYPISILEIEAEESLVDVNVHPTKQEVRFTDEYRLKELITKTLTNALESVELVYQQVLSPSKVEVKDSPKTIVEAKNDIKIDNNQSSYDWDDFVTTKPMTTNSNLEEQKEESKRVSFEKVNSILNNRNNDRFESPADVEDESENTLIFEKARSVSDKDWIDVSNDIEDETDFSYEMENDPTKKEIDYRKDIVEQQSFEFREEKDTFFSSMQYLGQYNKTYLLLEKDNDLYLLDQHAGMERYMYELISKKFKEEHPLAVELLIPLKIEVPLYEVELVLSKTDEFEKLGIQFEHFGSNVFLIRQIPTWIPEKLQTEFISDIINYSINNQKVSKALMYDNLAKMLSCKKSIKANMNILVEEVRSLLEKLDTCQNPFTCPHGRPTIIKFTKYEIEKLFKRVI